MKSASGLLDLLKQYELIQEAHNNEPSEPRSPWYIKILMGFCGWFAALFILGFFALGIVSLYDQPVALSAIGVVMMGASLALLNSKKSEFFEHLGLAFSFAGQALITFALFNQGELKDLSNWVILTFMCISLALLMPSYIHRFVSAYLATLCFSYSLFLVGVPSFFSSITLFLVGTIWLYEFNLGHQVRKLQAIGYGIVLGLMQFKTSILFSHSGQTWAQDMVPHVNQWLDETLNILTLLYIVLQLIRHKKVSLSKSHRWLSLAVVLLLCLGTFYANGIVVGLIFMLLGFAGQNRILLWLGLICALINLSSYYYLLNVSLLDKSFILCGLGILSLLLYYLNKRISVSESL